MCIYGAPWRPDDKTNESCAKFASSASGGKNCKKGHMVAHHFLFANDWWRCLAAKFATNLSGTK